MELIDHHNGVLRSNGASEVLGNFVVLVEGFGNHAHHVVVGDNPGVVTAAVDFGNDGVYVAGNGFRLLRDFRVTFLECINFCSKWRWGKLGKHECFGVTHATLDCFMQFG